MMMPMPMAVNAWTLAMPSIFRDSWSMSKSYGTVVQAARS
jgi:hypothetical protein